MIRTTLLLAAAASLLLAAAAVAAPKPSPPTKEELAKYAKAKVTIETKFGTIVARLFPDLAPMHVKNFVTLAESGFYDGTIFHRVIPKFMIQGGDPTGTGTGGPGYTIPAEFTTKKKHTRGVLSMARSRDPNSAGSQFFIVVADSPWLDGQYSIFGEVVSGMDVVDKIVAVPRNPADKPYDPVAMTRVTVSYGD